MKLKLGTLYRCNYINFRKNTLCLRCDHRRPKALNTRNVSAGPKLYSGKFGNNSSRRKNDDDCMWRFGGSEGEEHCRFPDFPSAESAERRKVEMLERRRSLENAMEKEEDLILRSDSMERRIEFVECSDDEDIMEWFEHKPEQQRVQKG